MMIPRYYTCCILGPISLSFIHRSLKLMDTVIVLDVSWQTRWGWHGIISIHPHNLPGRKDDLCSLFCIEYCAMMIAIHGSVR